MDTNTDELDEIIGRLKTGARLSKQKSNGKKFHRQFYLHERGEYISYQGSKKIFGKARKCKSRFQKLILFVFFSTLEFGFRSYS